MEHTVTFSQDDIARLQRFHKLHFPNQTIPDLQHHAQQDQTTDTPGEDGHSLGSYPDGVRRTLTDDQIAMFRNSEIQRIIQERHRAAEEKEAHRQEEQQKQNRSQAKHTGQKTWTRHFDEASQSVDTLMYDDEPTDVPQREPGTQKFLWPKLG